jgi:tRNA threonylcarbamoyl adenosine modification protein YjeE
MERVIRDLGELTAEADRVVKTLSKKRGGATLITLSGELGAGKTAFTKALAKALGVEEVVSSPTFVLEKVYALSSLGGETPKFKRLVHIDAYRLEKGNDLSTLGFDEIMEGEGSLVVLEWPERVGDSLPKPDLNIVFEVLPSGARHMTYA